MNRLLVVTASVALLCCPVSRADDKEKPKQLPPQLAKLIQGTPADFIKRFDKNGDGYLTKDELPPALTRAFDKMDVNGDGKLDRKEVAAMLQILRRRFGLNDAQAAKNNKTKKPDSPSVDRMVANWLERMDANQDGKISKEEAKAALAANFERFDLNKDGFLDKNELRQVAERFLAMQATNAGKNAAPARQSLIDFDALDRNADGRLTRDELKGTRFEAVFDAIDTNKDGKIDKKEFAVYLEKLAEQKKE